MKHFRIFHVLLGAAVLAAYVTGEDTGVIHALLGYAVAALIVLRVALGVSRKSGFTFARFRLAIPGGQRLGTGLRNPALGNGLTLALALAVTATATSGIVMDGGGTFVGKSVRLESESGEGGGVDDDDMDEERSMGLPGLASSNASEGEQGEDALSELHEVSGKLTLIMAIVHVVYTLMFRFNMVRFMLFMPAGRRT